MTYPSVSDAPEPPTTPGSIWTLNDDLSHLVYLVQTLVWMGGQASWPAETVAEQLGDFDDRRVHDHLGEAATAGLLTGDAHGYRLTDAGWALAAGSAERMTGKS